MLNNMLKNCLKSIWLGLAMRCNCSVMSAPRPRALTSVCAASTVAFDAFCASPQML